MIHTCIIAINCSRTANRRGALKSPRFCLNSPSKGIMFPIELGGCRIVTFQTYISVNLVSALLFWQMSGGTYSGQDHRQTKQSIDPIRTLGCVYNNIIYGQGICDVATTNYPSIFLMQERTFSKHRLPLYRYAWYLDLLPSQS